MESWLEKKTDLLLLQAKEMTPKIIEYVMENPKWEISLQTHKFLNIP